MATVSIEGADLVVNVEGMDKLWTLKSRLTIPMGSVRGATYDPGIVADPKGRRGPGMHVPGIIVAGTFHQNGAKVFWDVRDEKMAVVIELEHETYQRLVIQVPDPRATVALIERTLTHRDP